MSNETKVLIGIGLATIVIVVAATFLVGGKSTSTPQNATPVTNPEALIRKDSHLLKADSKKVTFVEFGDFQCPACGAAEPTVEQLLKDYKGKINFVYREFPLDVHQNSHIAAEAAEAAGAQGKFFEMHDLLFKTQKDWENDPNPIDTYVQYAKDLKLDTDRFKKEVTAKKYESKIQADIKDGFALGVNATPTFFINNVKQDGGIDYTTYKDKFDSLLKAK